MGNLTMKQKIKECYNDLSAREKQVAKYVIDNYQQSMLLSSSELAMVSGVSNTAVVRFAKALGFKGFLEYKKTIRKEYVPVQKVYATLPLIDRDIEGHILSVYMNNLKNDLAEYLRLIDDFVLTEMCKAIHESENLYLVGFGSDEVVVVFLKNYLNLMGVKCISIVEEGLALKEKMLHLSERDGVLLTAFPTLSESEWWVSEHSRLTGAKFMMITDSEITANQLGAKLFTAYYESSDMFFNSYVEQMIFCNAMLVRYYEMYQDEASEVMKKYDRVLKLNKKI